MDFLVSHAHEEAPYSKIKAKEPIHTSNTNNPEEQENKI